MRGRQYKPNRQRGSAPSELVVGALLVLIVFVAASPFYRAARLEASRQRCDSRRALIVEAEEQYRSMSPAHTYTMDVRDLEPMLSRVPECPDGGAYHIRLSVPEDRDAKGKPVGTGRLVIWCRTRSHSFTFGPPHP